MVEQGFLVYIKIKENDVYIPIYIYTYLIHRGFNIYIYLHCLYVFHTKFVNIHQVEGITRLLSYNTLYLHITYSAVKRINAVCSIRLLCGN